MAVAFDAVGPSAAGANSSGSATLSWSHTCGASATYLLIGVTWDGGTDTGTSLTAKYNTVAMTSLGIMHTNNATAGYLQVFGLASPGTGSALTVLLTAAGTTPGGLHGGSISFTGAGTATAGQTAFGNGSAAALSFTPTVTGNMVAAFCGAGNTITPTGTFTSRYNGSAGGGGAGLMAGSTLASTGSAMSATFTVANDFWAEIAVEVQAAGGAAVTGGKSRFVPQAIRRASLW